VVPKLVGWRVGEIHRGRYRERPLRHRLILIKEIVYLIVKLTIIDNNTQSYLYSIYGYNGVYYQYYNLITREW
jgi:hypothetical protein